MSLLIASQSTPDQTYELKLNATLGRVTCSCLGYKFSKHRYSCKHVRQLAELLALQLAG